MCPTMAHGKNPANSKNKLEVVYMLYKNEYEKLNASVVLVYKFLSLKF